MVCANIQGNTASGGTVFDGIRLRQRDTSTFSLERLNGGTGTEMSPAVVEAHVGSENIGAATVTVEIDTQFTGVPDGTCQVP